MGSATLTRRLPFVAVAALTPALLLGARPAVAGGPIIATSTNLP